jgi:peptidoglycan hydrolase-like protein with peptidoglycan-binding domain
MKKYLILLVLVFTASPSDVSAQVYSFGTDLSVGASGVEVAHLQTFLINKGFDIPAVSSGISDKGYFGSQTRLAVMKYQSLLGLPSTGYVGPLTRGKLNAVVSNQKPNSVKLQNINNQSSGTGVVVGNSTTSYKILDSELRTDRPTVVVLSPNGGQTIKQGQTVTVQWSAYNIPSDATMNINLSNKNGVVGQIVTGLNPNTSQSYTWNTSSPIGTISTISGLIPAYIYPDKYKIDLEVYVPVPVTVDNEKGMIVVSDLSDNYLTVTDSAGNLPVAPSISSVKPSSISNDNTTSATISGSGFNSSSAVYFSDTTYKYAYKTIPSSVSASGQSLTFSIAQNFPPAGQYQLTVSNDGIAMSNPLNFTVTTALPTSVTMPTQTIIPSKLSI